MKEQALGTDPGAARISSRRDVLLRALAGMVAGLASGKAVAIEADVPRFESGCYQFTILRPAQELPPLRLFRLEGGTTDLSALRGKPILLNFWASWCAACRMESPALDRLYRDAWRGRVHVAAVSLDEDHIERLRHLRRRYKPRLFSEHLAWSSHDAGFLNDLLPVPYTAETLKRVVEHIDQVQTALGCEMLLENPSTSSRSPRAHTRRPTSSPKSPGAADAACCSTSTTSSSRRPISNGIRWPTSKVIRSRA